jgi:mannose-6-phosphate isomerase-like protein (cupin superfamily)
MDWHSTRHREELLIALRGRVCVEVRAGAGHRRPRSIVLGAGECLWLSADIMHRVVNTWRASAHYLYVTGDGA